MEAANGAVVETPRMKGKRLYREGKPRPADEEEAAGWDTAQIMEEELKTESFLYYGGRRWQRQN